MLCPISALPCQINQISDSSRLSNCVMLSRHQGRPYYMYTPAEAFRNGLRDMEKRSLVELDFLKPSKNLLSSRCFQRHFSITRSKSFIFAPGKLMSL